MSEKAKKQNNDVKAGMIEKPIIRRVDSILRYTEDGAFDIPTMITSVAMDYFSCNIALEDAKMELYQGGHLMGTESNEDILKYLKESLKGNERFYEFIQP